MNISTQSVVYGKVCLFLITIISITLLGSCKHSSTPDPEPTEQEKVTTYLTGNGGQWKPAALTNWVMVEGINVTDLFKDFTITFTSTGYTTTGTTPVWPRTDTWKFKDATGKVLIRDSDKKEVTIESLDANNFRLTLVWDQETTTGGRTQSVKGKHEFILSK